jgi:hypothetical protein
MQLYEKELFTENSYLNMYGYVTDHFTLRLYVSSHELCNILYSNAIFFLFFSSVNLAVSVPFFLWYLQYLEHNPSTLNFYTLFLRCCYVLI